MNEPRSDTILVTSKNHYTLFNEYTAVEHSNTELTIVLKEGATLEYFVYGVVHSSSNIQQKITINAEKNSSCYVYLLLHVKGNCNITCEVTLNEQAAQVVVAGTYLIAEQGTVEFKSQQMHNAPLTTSSVIMRGALYDSAYAYNQGLVTVHLPAYASGSRQESKHLLLSPHARATAYPTLEVLTNEIKCGHGAAVGGLDKDALLYLQSRGIPAHHAQKLLVSSFLNEVYASAPEVMRTYARNTLACYL